MSDNSSLRAQIASMRQSLFDEGMLNDHYVRLEQLEVEDSPLICENVMNMFIRDSGVAIGLLEQYLLEPEFNPQVMDPPLRYLNRGSSYVGAAKVLNEANIMGEILKANGNSESFRNHLALLKTEVQNLEDRFTPYFMMLWQLESQK